jgi:hypothetical protein
MINRFIFDSYSNTFLVSLNNRIAIRDKNEARGAVIDRQVMTPFKSSARPSAPQGYTTDTLLLEPEKPSSLKGRMDQPVPEAEVVDGVNSESCNRRVIVSSSYSQAVAMTSMAVV